MRERKKDRKIELQMRDKLYGELGPALYTHRYTHIFTGFPVFGKETDYITRARTSWASHSHSLGLSLSHTHIYIQNASCFQQETDNISRPRASWASHSHVLGLSLSLCVFLSLTLHFSFKFLNRKTEILQKLLGVFQQKRDNISCL